MKIIEVSVRRGVTINLQKYESVRIDVELRAAVEDNSSVAIGPPAYVGVYQQLNSKVKDLLKEQVDEIELGAQHAKSKAGRFGV